MTSSKSYAAAALVVLAVLASAPSEAEAGPIAASVCIAGCNIAFGACAGCGVAATTVTAGAAAPAASFACTVAYTACVGACTASSVLPTP